MKIFSLLTALILTLSLSSAAQNKNTGKAVISTPTVQCDMCKSRIEKYLKHEQGVTSAKVDVKKKTTTVTWVPDRANIETVKTAIANAGYDADDITAEETVYNKLPACCKKPVEKEKPEQKN